MMDSTGQEALQSSGADPRDFAATGESYGATNNEGTENSKLMATAMAGIAMDTVKGEAAKLHTTVAKLREGPVSIKILSYVAGILLVVAGFFSFFGNFFTLHPIDAVVHLYLFLFGWIILFVEARSSILPKSFVETIHKYAAFLTVVWGRGGFFIFIGTLALAQWSFVDIILGLYLCALGSGMIYWGKKSLGKLDALTVHMKDPSVVQSTFAKFANGDGELNVKELGDLLKELGANMNPAEVEVAIFMLDKNNSGSIDLQEFEAWWRRHDLIQEPV